MHEPECIDNVKRYAPHSAGVFRYNQVVVIGIGIGDTAAAGRYVVEPTFVEGLEKCEEGPGLPHLLRVDQLLAATKLAGGDVVLHTRDHHRNDGPRLRYAGDLGRHSGFHDLRFNLSEAGLKALGASLRDQDPGGTHERIDDVAHAERELFHPPAYPGTDNRLF